VILEKDCTGGKLYEEITKLLKDKDRLKRMSLAQRSLAVPNAAGKIVDIVLELCRNRLTSERKQ